jgi:hypothetical protein
VPLELSESNEKEFSSILGRCYSAKTSKKRDENKFGFEAKESILPNTACAFDFVYI